MKVVKSEGAEEAEMVLREDFYEPKTYYSILRAIALGRRRLSEIMDETGLEKSKISKYLKVLQDLLVVEREVPITEKNIEKSGISRACYSKTFAGSICC